MQSFEIIYILQSAYFFFNKGQKWDWKIFFERYVFLKPLYHCTEALLYACNYAEFLLMVTFAGRKRRPLSL